LLSVAVVSVLVLLVVNYSLKVVELVSLLLVVNYVVDLMMCVILVLCMIYSACFGGSLSGEAAKTGSGKKIKLLYS
jgi:TctA family transporter